jgi:pimeloyl-ACP methyl ester carboxylesterase
LTAEFLNRIRTQGSGIILVEGRRTTQNPISLELRRGGRLVLRQFFGLSTSGVEDMYRFKSLLTAGGGPSLPGDRLDEPANYPDELGSTRNFVFLHGYNVTANESRGWQSEMFKRLFWSGSRARFFGVSWYGYETKIGDLVTPDYHVNVDNAFQTSGALAAFLGQLSADGKTTVAAHSLGNMVVSAALQDFSPPVENYFMIDAAVALEAYDASETRSRSSPNHNMVHFEWDGPGGAYKESLRASEWYTHFPEDDHRRSLTWRGRFDRVPVANVWNYYSSGEEVLGTHPQSSWTAVAWTQFIGFTSGVFSSDEIDVELGRHVWALQEKNKGRGINLLSMSDPVRLGSSDVGGWGFNRDDYFVQDAENDRRHMTLAEANDIDTTGLREKPFFRKGRESELYTSAGSEYARIHRDRLLGEMIPARSLPAGANKVQALKVGYNLDMNSLFQSGWPQSRVGARRREWRHSDVTDVAYLFVWPLFESFVQNGALARD